MGQNKKKTVSNPLFAVTIKIKFTGKMSWWILLLSNL